MTRFLLPVLAVVLVGRAAAGAEGDYRPGGPLAGLRGYDFSTQAEPLYPGGAEYFQANHSPCHPLFDRQSLHRLWVAPGLPAAPARPAEAYRPPQVRPYRGPGPFPVVRCGVRAPTFTLDLGELAPSLYAVRVVGTVDPGRLRPFREPLYLGLRVYDRTDGGTSTYRVRAGYADDLYSVAEIYFHAPRRQGYRAELWVDRGSTVELLVHALVLDDVMAGVDRRPWKTRRTLHNDRAVAALRAGVTPEERQSVAAVPALTPAARLARDEALWHWLPPLNAATTANDFSHPEAVEGAAGQSLAEVEKAHGRWEPEGGADHGLTHALALLPPYDGPPPGAFLVNRKLNLRYTLADLAAGRPLPAPFPYPDDGPGLYYPDQDRPGQGRFFVPVARAVQQRLRQAATGWSGAARLWVKTGHPEIGRDVAVLLARYAWQFPSLDCGQAVTFAARQPCYQDYDFRCRNRMTKAYWMFQYDGYLEALAAYDLIFDYVQDNQALADSLHRFIPAVRTPADVVAFFDAFLVQHTAKRSLRGHDHTWKSAVATVGATLGAPAQTDAWVRPYADGLLAQVLNDTDADGCKRLGSSFYCHGEGAAEHAEALDRYVAAGGGGELSLLRHTRRPLHQCEWALDLMVAGGDWLRVGDVTGPGEPFGRARPWAEQAAGPGWRWGGDPRFAWILRHARGRRDETDGQWRAVEAAAAGVRRAPWLDNPSRVIGNWAGILETGREHDDPRLRGAAYVRAGRGSGHAHDDPLDLQFVQGGLAATIEGGQRSGYSKPNDKLRRVHNTVEVHGVGAAGEGGGEGAYVRCLADAAGAGYLEAVGWPLPAGVGVYRRQVALVDGAPGSGSRPFSVRQQLREEDWPRGVTPAQAYLVDVFRVAGGRGHSYGFHATVNDDFRWNAVGVGPVAHAPPTAAFDSDAAYLAAFEWTPESKFAGTAPEALQAVWRMVRFEKDTRGRVSEEAVLGRNFDPDGPRYFTRLHLLGAAGLRVLRADVLQAKCAEEENLKVPGPPRAGYRWTCLSARRLASGEPLESAFVGVVEPYRGEPFLASARLLDVPGNEGDARRAVAVEVQHRGGRTDLVFADGRPGVRRQAGPARVSGDYAFLSADARGLRQAALCGGTLLEAPGVRLVLPRAAAEARVLRTDPAARAADVDSPWPGGRAGQVVEVAGGDRRGSYTLAAPPDARPDGCRLVFTRDAILSADPGTGTLRHGIQAGDTVRAPALVNVRRAEGGGFTVEGNSDVEVTLAGGQPRRLTAAECSRPGGVTLPGGGN